MRQYGVIFLDVDNAPNRQSGALQICLTVLFHRRRDSSTLWDEHEIETVLKRLIAIYPDDKLSDAIEDGDCPVRSVVRSQVVAK